MRQISLALLAALGAAANRVCILVELDFPSGFVRAHNWIGPFTLIDEDGQALEFLGVGDLGAIAGIEQPEELRAVDITVKISGVDPALAAASLGDNYQGRRFRIWLGCVAESEAALVGVDAVLIARGQIDNADREVGETATITVNLRNHLADWDRLRISRYSDAEQQRLHPGDTFCSRVPVAAEKTIVWGR